MPPVVFGTSGWRALIADEFTFPNVGLAVQAIAGHLSATKRRKRGVLVSYDGRFAGDRFAALACQVLAANGIRSYLTRRDTPTPAVAYEQLRRHLDAAINFTASHNPPEYGGLKFNPHWGGPATKDITHDIEVRAAALAAKQGRGVLRMDLGMAVQRGLVRHIDPIPGYLGRISSLVDLRAIRKAGLKVVVDPMHGAGRACVETVLAKAGVRQLTALHTDRDPLFGGGSPEPAEGHLDELVRTVRAKKAHLGVATDGDADRFGIVDTDGSFIPPNLVLALLVRHLHRTRPGWKGAVLRSVVSSHFIDAVAASCGRELVEVPVGFKWIGQYMLDHDILVGGEESGGLTVHRHVPEKDGPLACLLMAEMRAVEGRSFQAVLRQMYRELGHFVVGRSNFRLTAPAMLALGKRLQKDPPLALAHSRVARHITLDGHKFVLEDGSWLAVRFSGTEPLVRLYLEAASSKRLEQLRLAGKKLIGG